MAPRATKSKESLMRGMSMAMQTGLSLERVTLALDVYAPVGDSGTREIKPAFRGRDAHGWYELLRAPAPTSVVVDLPPNVIDLAEYRERRFPQPEPHSAQVIDLFEALKQSLNPAARKRMRREPRAPSAKRELKRRKRKEG